jgi:hypothetical protein
VEFKSIHIPSLLELKPYLIHIMDMNITDNIYYKNLHNNTTDDSIDNSQGQGQGQGHWGQWDQWSQWSPVASMALLSMAPLSMPPPSMAPRVEWTTQDEERLITYLTEHKAQGGDTTSFKPAVWEGASCYIDGFRIKGAPKTAKGCKLKFAKVCSNFFSNFMEINQTMQLKETY